MHRKKHKPNLKDSICKCPKSRCLQITQNSKLFFTPLFPKNFHQFERKRNLVLLGIGGNIGNCIQRFQSLILLMSKNPKIRLLSTSPIYQNPPFGFVEQEMFYNAVLELETSYNLVEMFGIIFYWERRFGRGRKREFKNAPRTLDIDFLWFNQLKIKRPYLIIPHLYWKERESVLIPLRFQKLVSKRGVQ